ncbi:MAG: (Fe-S)-binding protein [Candidatus Thorarchaeota archaeon]|nr:(Fe-S)-binding protein [Candidatus Thorarchaeota archaeon]
MTEEEAFEFAKATLKKERITPFHPDELEVIQSLGHCINCGLCINHCPVVAAVGVDRFSGPRSIATELSRSPSEFWTTGDVVYLCTGCGTCREVCPKNVNIPEIVNMIRSSIFQHRPDLVPKGLHAVREVLLQHNLAFEPWDDPEEKDASRDMRLERLGLPLVPDRIKKNASVLFYPGCQAEERTQEVREAAKAILDFFEVDFTVLEEMSCCGLPARLMGDDKTGRSLASELKKKVKNSGAAMVVTTCAGCTSNLSDISVRDKWGLPVYHFLEFLIEKIGTGRLQSHLKSRSKDSRMVITIHDPCHLIRHTSRQIMDHAVSILQLIPGVSVKSSRAADSCCGGGGLVSYHSKEVANAVVRENLAAIEATGADRVVAPCPLCTAQIESNLFRSGSSVEVDDLTVFIAQHLPLKE